ncbi:MAG TPA: hypothetical protein DEQ28_04465 [Clostridiales bacterium]|nr:hypothetical protein [Clostridiales bacterium]
MAMRRIAAWVMPVVVWLQAASPAWGTQFPSPLGPVNDYAGVLTRTEVAELEAISLELEAKTGAALVVAIVHTHEPESLENYVTGLFEHWGIGQRGEDNGVLIFLAMDDAHSGEIDHPVRSKPIGHSAQIDHLSM